jgi:hypothetical protein
VPPVMLGRAGQLVRSAIERQVEWEFSSIVDGRVETKPVDPFADGKVAGRVSVVAWLWAASSTCRHAMRVRVFVMEVRLGMLASPWLLPANRNWTRTQ